MTVTVLWSLFGLVLGFGGGGAATLVVIRKRLHRAEQLASQARELNESALASLEGAVVRLESANKSLAEARSLNLESARMMAIRNGGVA